MKRRRFLRVALFVAATGGVATTAHAEAVYPARPLRMIVPFPPGSGTDASARFLSKQIGEALGQPVVVENKAGGNGVIAAQAAAKAPGDGYTLFITTMTTQSVNPHLYARLPYDPVKDFTPVGLIYKSPSVLVVRNEDGQPKTLSELTAKARAAPAKVIFSSGNMSSRVAAELYAHQVHAKLLHIPYKGATQAVTELLGGQVDLMFADLANAMPHIRSGRLKALAVVASQRLQTLPNVQTMDELGVGGMNLIPWSALYVPASTPRSIVERLSTVLLQVLGTPAARTFFTRYGAELTPLPPEKTAAFLVTEYTAWGNAIRVAGVEAD